MATGSELIFEKPPYIPPKKFILVTSHTVKPDRRGKFRMYFLGWIWIEEEILKNKKMFALPFEKRFFNGFDENKQAKYRVETWYIVAGRNRHLRAVKGPLMD